MSEVNKIFNAVKKELCSRKGLGWDELDQITGEDGIEKEVDDAVKSAIKNAMPDYTALKSQNENIQKILKQATTFSFISFQASEYDIPEVVTAERTRMDKDAWAVRHRGMRLSRRNDWTWEPLPSSRTDDYLETHTFTLEQALMRAEFQANKIGADRKQRGK